MWSILLEHIENLKSIWKYLKGFDVFFVYIYYLCGVIYVKKQDYIKYMHNNYMWDHSHTETGFSCCNNPQYNFVC